MPEDRLIYITTYDPSSGDNWVRRIFMEREVKPMFIPWLVWSNEHNAFWAPNRHGYTKVIAKAGRYSQQEAEQICRSASFRANSTIHSNEQPEVCFPAPETAEMVLVLGEALKPFVERYEGWSDDEEYQDSEHHDSLNSQLNLGAFRKACKAWSSAFGLDRSCVKELARLRNGLAMAAVRLGICVGRMRGANEEARENGLQPPHQLIDECEFWEADAREALNVPPRGDILYMFPNPDYDPDKTKEHWKR